MKLCKIRNLNLGKALLFPRNQVICLKNWKFWRTLTTIKFDIFCWNFAHVTYSVVEIRIFHIPAFYNIAPKVLCKKSLGFGVAVNCPLPSRGFRGRNSLEYFQNLNNQNPIKTIFLEKNLHSCFQFRTFLNWICTTLYIYFYFLLT